MTNENKCPVMHGNQKSVSRKPMSNQDWWPNQLNLKPLNHDSSLSNPMQKRFSYHAEFKGLDVEALQKDIFSLMTTSQDWWPADYGHYGPFFIRMAWHGAGTYRVADGRGGAGSGAQRFLPISSWPDNANLDKARRLLWPIKQKYGRRISWADLLMFTGTCALQSMGLKTFGFAFGREDRWEPDEITYWGPEEEWLGDERFNNSRDLESPLGSTQMGLIYVNPEGPNGNPDPIASARDIRETFSRMAMNDEETVALIAGGHTFGKCHGAADPNTYIGPAPDGADIEEQGFGWKNSFGKGNADDTITSGLEGAWTSNPIKWDNNYFENLFGYEWVITTSPAGAKQWVPKEESANSTVIDAFNPAKKHAPMMATTDIALLVDTQYALISKRFYQNPAEFADVFAKAWYKLTHRDMGPITRCLGPLVPSEPQLWQDPVPNVTHKLIRDQEIITLKSKLLASGLSISQMVKTAWASASTYRNTDKRGGANGARIRLAPQKDWAVNQPTELTHVIQTLENIQKEFNNTEANGTNVSLADLIILGGCAAIEQAAKDAGYPVKVSFIPGRTDASQEQTDIESFSVLEPTSDGFRNYLGHQQKKSEEELLVERAELLTLTAPEMTVLIGGMRALDANFMSSKHGVLTKQPGKLTNDFFINLLDMKTIWKKSSKLEGAFDGYDRLTGEIRWISSRVDLIFGSNSQLRAISEYYACDDAEKIFVDDFVAAWEKVMDLDRVTYSS